MKYNTTRYNALKTKRTLVSSKKFEPKKIGDEKAKILTDDEMKAMHKVKMGTGMMGKVTAPHLPRATMMFKEKTND